MLKEEARISYWDSDASGGLSSQENYVIGYKDGYNKANAELKAQVEKMKCCGNCNHFDFNEPNYCHKGVFRERQYVCSKWEFVN